MNVEILKEAGYEEAMLGLSLSHLQPVEDMPAIAYRLAYKDAGHNKFLESIVVWLDIAAPRYWWQQFDTYRVGITKQSESTMHTLMNRKLKRSDFEYPIHLDTLRRLNELIEGGYFEMLKSDLPEGFLQRRIVCTNYKVLRHIVLQRKDHRLPEWQFFISEIRRQVGYYNWLLS